MAEYNTMSRSQKDEVWDGDKLCRNSKSLKNNKTGGNDGLAF